ncbi:DEAD/DEAH box helicase [Ruania halotolerans]|uniref:DEAD/DEAH box helicase n=1 Tax=Ruania halotolerans TaxID=2897773 RepID=UPI001E629AA3|nr:DEAD/DEAH box helicase [Ruania halotolerans]UFU04756.1 DEAD/DEAH box helicase [Ruania halotolerans]
MSAAPVPSSFDDLGLPKASLAAIAALGFTTPTDIQSAAIPALLEGRDLVGVAQTGTGKTAAFALPMLARVDAGQARVQGLVLTPTRELAIQVADAITTFASGSGANVLAIYGGAPYGPQLRGLSRGAQIVVGTPGRVIDMLEKGALDLSAVRSLVLDEADEMLRMGFAEDVDRILSSAAEDRQTALFSATMPPAIRSVARRHMNNPVEVATSRQSSTTDTITQTYAVVPFRHKVGALARVLATTDAEAAVVFVRTRQAAEEVGAALQERGVSAATISGDVAQKERERIVERLRSGSVQVLVATDVAARGLDVDKIGLVVNFDVPREAEAYVHRIGRTGRAGRSGQALTFFTPKERSRLTAIERLTRTSLTEATIPTPAQVSAHRAQGVLNSLSERISAGRLDMYREHLANHLGPDGDPMETAAALLALAVGDSGPRSADELHEAPAPQDRFDRESGPSQGARGGAGSRGRRTPNGTVYRVAVGHSHGARPQDIVGAITGEGGLRGSDLGKIDIFSRFSLVEIGAELSSDANRKLSVARVAGQPLRIRPDTGPTSHRGADRPSSARPRRDTRFGSKDGARRDKPRAGAGAGRSH